MSGAIPPLSQYAFISWYPVRAQGQLYLLRLPLCVRIERERDRVKERDGFNSWSPGYIHSTKSFGLIGACSSCKFRGLDSLDSSELDTNPETVNPFGQSRRIPWTGDRPPSQGLYPHGEAQHRKTETHIYACSGILTQDLNILPA
jgi:hypothetical protein